MSVDDSYNFYYQYGYFTNHSIGFIKNKKMKTIIELLEKFKLLKRIYRKRIYRKIMSWKNELKGRYYVRPFIYSRYGERLKTFKDIHNGERCFIIGNGPSLRVSDLERLKGKYSFAANKIFVVFDETEWRPTYYCIQDFLMIETEWESLKKYVDVKHKFMAGNPLIKKKTMLDDWLCFYINPKLFYPNLPEFSNDISREISEGYTVTYAAIQLAAYMGFKEIYLLGVDHSYSKIINNSGEVTDDGTQDYFSEKYMQNRQFGTHSNYANLENSTLAYMAARQYADKNGIKIYNATRGGKLEVFERVDFDSLF
jgi:hypothetical protein